MISGIRRLVRERVVVTTTDDRSIRGILASAHRDCVVIAEPEYLHEAKSEEMAGRAVVLRDRISYIQVLS